MLCAVTIMSSADLPSLSIYLVSGRRCLSSICVRDSFIDTNLIHIFLYKLHKIKFLYMSGASSAHLQEVMMLIVHVCSL